jgi:hypothetical protein
VVRIASTYIRRKWWWITHNPRNPVIKYLIYRQSLKMAEEIMAQINTKEESKD